MSTVGMWVVSSDGELFGDEEFATREEAIANGREEHASFFWVGEVAPLDLPSVSVEHVLEHALDHIGEQVGEAAEHFTWTDGQARELGAELTGVLRAWMKKHGMPGCFHVNGAECITPESSESP